MLAADTSFQRLLSLPPAVAGEFEALEGRRQPDWFAASDPGERPLGSGAGTANLLAAAWRATAPGTDFSEWLRQSRKLVIHGGGQGRRLPAYAPTGKLLTPIPVLRSSRGQRLDQCLLDLQMTAYERLLAQADAGSTVMIASGDAVLELGRELPTFPKADVLLLGMWAPPEKATSFGVFFVSHADPAELAFSLQKPSPARIRELGQEYTWLVDTGIWLLSERALDLLMARCGWDDATGQFAGGIPTRYELYSQFGLALGQKPTRPDPAIEALSCAVVALRGAQFYHFGTSRDLIESVAALQSRAAEEKRPGLTSAWPEPAQINQNSRFQAALRHGGNRVFWVENSVIPAGWQFSSDHILTGVPENDWSLQLEPGVCLDFVPVGAQDYCVRAYGLDDAFAGIFSDTSARWFGRAPSSWFDARNLRPTEYGISPDTDLQCCPLFPVLMAEQLDPEFLQWLFAKTPNQDTRFEQLWRSLPRLSAQDLRDKINVRRLYGQRSRLRQACLSKLIEHSRSSVFFQLDLEVAAKTFAETDAPLPERGPGLHDEPMHRIHDPMFRSAVLRHRQDARWPEFEARAFGQLRELMVSQAQLAPAKPIRNVLEDQIVWARSPVRFDLAGGWSDTPPYCLQQGGKVVNLAADLNGQPPIQVFARLAGHRQLVVRSIDLGVEQRISDYAELENFGGPGNSFALAKAAFALAGFLPGFQAQPASASLQQQLVRFGAGIEVSLLAAVPKGSGLGASSILAMTILAALNDLCGLGWDRLELFNRTLALEQILTTGGGWQDQAGAIFRGLKSVQTAPGLSQKPLVQWLPDNLFDSDYANRRILLYYTGITRLAKNILAQIVRGIFLNSPFHLGCIADIAANADFVGTALQRCNYEMLRAGVRRSWDLNQRLDPGTNPPEVQAILKRIEDHAGAAKLLGAGGGGYLLIFAKDESSAMSIRRDLLAQPPNPLARFVDFRLSATGLQVTRS